MAASPLPQPGAVTPLPPTLLARATAWLTGTVDPVATRDAATIALVRDSSEGLQAYLMRRVATMAFAAGMHVFPGGGVDLRDEDASLRWEGPSPSWWADRLSCDEPLARALVCAAVRETFEESGVLLAGPSADEVVADTSGDDWEADRRSLVDREVALAEVLHRRGLVLRTDLLRPWAHWITPEFEHRRYDTRFFVAAVPAGQRTRHVGGEADRVAWLRPADALRRHGDGDLAMLPPTVATLASLRDFADVDAALSHVPPIVPLLPRAVRLSDGGVGLLLEEATRAGGGQ